MTAGCRALVAALALLLLPAAGARGEEPIAYLLDVTAAASTGRVRVTMTLPVPVTAPADLVMPRGYPGGYALFLYDQFVEDVKVFSPAGAVDLAQTLLNYAHHMAHSWIPKRAHAAGYAPYTWEAPPVYDTIWFNEGFGRYAGIQALADGMPPAEGVAFRARTLARLKRILDEAPPFIRRMPLAELSRSASFMYSADFRIGMSTFARGALMAAEMDEKIRAATGGAKSLKDGLRALLKSPQPFRTEDLPAIFRSATGADVREILERWMK